MKLAPLALVLVACSPLIVVKAAFTLPKDADPSRLHVRGRVACRSFNLSDPEPVPPAPPEPGLDETDEGDAGGPRSKERPVVFSRDGDLFDARFNATSCWLAMTAFYDTNGDGVVGAGDLVAKVPAREVTDRGLCAGNLNAIGAVALEPVKR